jgi:hypothetical protein
MQVELYQHLLKPGTPNLSRFFDLREQILQRSGIRATRVTGAVAPKL